MNLRVRVSATATIGALLACSIVAVGAWYGVRDATYDEAATSVRSMAQVLQREELPRDGQLMRECLEMRNAVPVEGTAEAGPLQQALWVVHADGRACSLDGGEIPAVAIEVGRPVARAQGRGASAELHADGTHMTARAEPIGAGLSIVAARSVEEADRVLARLAWLLAIVAGAGGLVALAAGALVVRMLTRPVLALARDVELVAASGDASLRVADPDQLAEVRPLVDRINDMLTTMHGDVELRRERVADASHDARSPLTSLRASIELLSLDEVSIASPDEARAILSDAIAEIDELHEAIRDLERCSADEPDATSASVDLAAVASKVVQRARRRHPSRSIELVADESGPWVTGDARDLERAVWNLVHNALHHAGPEARIMVHVTGSMVVVSDDGCGIPAEEIEVALRRHGRGSAALATARPGSGLGLALARRIVRDSGGTLELRSSERGTTATIDFGGAGQ